jgi:hypothetical protein
MKQDSGLSVDADAPSTGNTELVSAQEFAYQRIRSLLINGDLQASAGYRCARRSIG